MKNITLTSSLFVLLSMGTAYAQKGAALPNVQAPRELTEQNSEFLEGTVTRLTEQDISVFIPWAQNAQSVLTKALRDIETMSIENQVKHLTLVMKSVVRNSGEKNYQMFMRFALNRTILLVRELTSQSDWSKPGTAVNVLDLQVKGINLALQFHESDLEYQKRISQGNGSTELEYGKFGAIFGKTMFMSIQNVIDASAQYRLLYKTLEMINWDFSRDAAAIEFADTIVEIHNTLSLLPETASNDDANTVLDIRRLNVLLTPVSQVERTIMLSNERTRAEYLERTRLAQESAERIETENRLKSGITVVAENAYFFILNGSSQGDMFRDCIEKMPSNRIDEITYTYGNSLPKNLFNSSGYWDKRGSCEQIFASLKDQTHISEKFMKITGTIEERAFSYSGSNISSLFYQCYNDNKNSGRVDDIYITIDNSIPRGFRNDSGYWTGPVSICNLILEKAYNM